MRYKKEEVKEVNKEDGDSKLLECIVLAGLIARGSWELDDFNVKNVLIKKVKPIVAIIRNG